MSVDVWFGLCENSHNAKAKNKEYKNIVNFFQINGPNAQKVSMLGVEIIFYGNFMKNWAKRQKNVWLYNREAKMKSLWKNSKMWTK